MDEALTFKFFFDQWELFRMPALSATLAGALLGFLGVYIVLRRMVFLSAALSQSAGLGVTLAFFAQIHLGVPALLASPLLGATGLTLLTAALLSLERSAGSSRRDSFLGLAYLIGAAGALAVATRITQEAHDIGSILLGSAVIVSEEDFRIIWIMVLILGVLHVWWARGFIQTSIERDSAQVRGLPVRLLEILLLLTLAVAISVSTRVLGALPVFAFSVLPAMAALRLALNVPLALVLSALLGASSGFLGYLVAFRYQLPVGASQALVAVAWVGLAEVLRLLRRPRLAPTAAIPVQEEP